MRAIFAVLGTVGAIGTGTAALAVGGWALSGRAVPPPLDTAPMDTGTADTGAGGPVTPSIAGQLVITEIMAAPAETYDEWFEVYNASDLDLDLNGCVLDSTGSGSTAQQYTINATTTVAPGARIALNKLVDTTSELACIDADCHAPAAHRYKTLTFSNSALDNLSITCGGALIDDVDFNWGSFSTACGHAQTDAGTTGGCALDLSPEILDAAANDDATSPGAWNIPPTDATYTDARGALTLGTPGDPNLVAAIDTGGDSGTDTGGTDTGPLELPADACTAGQAILTEFMPNPKDSGYNDEWIEVRGLVDSGQCNIQACEVQIAYGDGTPYQAMTIDTPTGSLEVKGGAYAVLARGSSDEAAAGITWVSATDGATVTADYVWGYNDLSLPNCDGSNCDWTVSLVCGDQVVDSAPLSWATFENQAGSCPSGGCSVNLHPSYESTSGNDDLAHWCIPPSDGNTWTYSHPAASDGSVQVTTLAGTPGHAGACPALDWPDKMAFTEIMPSPSGTNEWFEMVNLSGRPVDLTLCTLRRYRLNDAGAETSVEEFDIGSDGPSLTLGTDAVQIFAKSGCILKDDPGVDTAGADTAGADTAGADTAGADTAGNVGACTWGEYSYSSLSFTDATTEHLQLECPTADLSRAVIDDISYNTDLQFDEQGHSLSFDPTGVEDPATANDDTTAWCVAGYSQEFCQAGDTECNYGTPGELLPCADTPTWPTGSVCRCATVSPRASWMPLLAGLLAWARRRERRG